MNGNIILTIFIAFSLVCFLIFSRVVKEQKKLINMYAKKIGSDSYEEMMQKLIDNPLKALSYAMSKTFSMVALPAGLGGMVVGPFADELVVTVGRPAGRNWFYMPKGSVGPNTMAIYDREFLANLYEGMWGFTFQNTKKMIRKEVVYFLY